WDYLYRDWEAASTIATLNEASLVITGNEILHAGSSSLGTETEDQHTGFNNYIVRAMIDGSVNTECSHLSTTHTDFEYVTTQVGANVGEMVVGAPSVPLVDMEVTESYQPGFAVADLCGAVSSVSDQPLRV